MKIYEMMDNSMTYTEIAKALGMTKSNVAKLCGQEKIRRGETMGHVDPALMRSRYIDNAESIENIAKDVGCSIIQMRRYLQAHGIFRDRGYQHRAGVKKIWNDGVRNPSAKRNRYKSKFMSDEHKEKLAAAKRGKFGELANNWKGGVWLPGSLGYSTMSNKGKRTYRHRFIAATLLKRDLLTDEEVHHINMNRLDNSPQNLIVIGSKDHVALHRAMKKDKNLDQRLWLVQNNIKHEDLINYAKDRFETTH